MKTEVRSLSISELLALYQFVSAKPFSSNDQAKKIIKERLLEIEDELMDRAFGLNPYKIEKLSVQPAEKSVVVVKYEGEDPTKVLKESPLNLVGIKEKDAADQIAADVAKDWGMEDKKV